METPSAIAPVIRLIFFVGSEHIINCLRRAVRIAFVSTL